MVAGRGEGCGDWDCSEGSIFNCGCVWGDCGAWGLCGGRTIWVLGWEHVGERCLGEEVLTVKVFNCVGVS